MPRRRHIEALSFLVSLEAVPLVGDKAKDLFGGVWPPGELGESCGKEVVAAGGSCDVVAGRVDGVAGGALVGGVGGKLAVVAGGLGGGDFGRVAASAAMRALFRASMVPLPFFFRLSAQGDT